jgi:hypothetical protein
MGQTGQNAGSKMVIVVQIRNFKAGLCAMADLKFRQTFTILRLSWANRGLVLALPQGHYLPCSV